jgi:hypothetical protein
VQLRAISPGPLGAWNSGRPDRIQAVGFDAFAKREGRRASSARWTFVWASAPRLAAPNDAPDAIDVKARIAIVVLSLGLLAVPMSSAVTPAARHHSEKRHRHHRHHRRHKRHHVRRHHRASHPVSQNQPVAVNTSSNSVVFSGGFDSSLSQYPSHWGSCFSQLNSQQILFHVTSTSSCDPGQDGHYRSDLNTANIYPAGVPECTTIPIDFPFGDPAGATDDTWLVFAETEDPNNPNQDDQPGWEMGLNAYFNGNTASSANQWYVAFTGYDNGVPAWTGPNVTSGWHTLSLCTNDANSNTGTVYGIWFDGVRQTFNHGPDAGAQSLSGFPLLQGDPANQSNWPLIIDDYTGGHVDNALIHGVPLVARMGPSGLPPEPSGGWNSP